MFYVPIGQDPPCEECYLHVVFRGFGQQITARSTLELLALYALGPPVV